MNDIRARLDSVGDDQIRSMRRGLEKESLRARGDGWLALTPHPDRLGSPLTHPQVTTDFSESQVELITQPHASTADCRAELESVHRAVHEAIGKELLWASSMPCGLPVDETIPVARYGKSNIGRLKSVYRMGLSHRYGRRMQTISGVHYNWSMDGLDNEQLLALIRNFRRHAFVLLYLFGAAPALCTTFVADREHSLTLLGDRTLHAPFATSLRMGSLGYQSNAQASICASFNTLAGYGASLQEALSTPWPEYERVGIRNPGGEYMQLSTSLLQIENEFYGLIRPKRAIERGERPLNALRERGIQYVEVRCLDLDPFDPLGVAPTTMHFLDVFLLHCLLSDSPADSPAEIADMGLNQQRTAHDGRRPGLTLQRGGEAVELRSWATELVQACEPIAARLDAATGTDVHTGAVREAMARIEDAARTPSARVLASISQTHDGSFVRFGVAQSRAARAALGLRVEDGRVEGVDEHAARLLDEAVRAQALIARVSIEEQKALELADTMPFEAFRQHYLDPARLIAG